MSKPKLSEKLNNFSQLLIPIVALFILVVFNLIRDPAFFSIGIKVNNLGHKVLTGNLVSILNGASELVILAIGMTLVTSATKGQDISIGASAAIAGSIAGARFGYDNIPKRWKEVFKTNPLNYETIELF